MKKLATETKYDRLATLLKQDQALTRGEPDDDLAGLTPATGDRLLLSDKETRPIPTVAGIEALHCFVQEHPIDADDIPEVGPGTAITEILSGRALFDAIWGRALGIRFSRSSHTFLIP